MAACAPELYDGPTESLGDTRSMAPEGLTAGDRIDPYWSDFWPVGSKASWVNVHQMHRQMAGGFARPPWWLNGDEAGALDRLHGRRLQETLAIVGALTVWQNMSAEQLAAVTGIARLASGRSALMTDLFHLGLVDVGVHTDALRRTDRSARSNLYRLARGSAVEQVLYPLTSYAERLRVTAGVEEAAIGAGMHDRHGVVTTEVGLRIAETCGVGAVLGEHLGRIQDLISGGWHPSFDADAVVVREDGLRVAIELTASTSNVPAKLARWCRLLAQKPLRDSGLVVLFVTAENPNRDTFVSRNVRKRTFDAIRLAVRNTPGFPGNRTSERIGVIDWRDWFPSPGRVSSWMAPLNAWFPTGPPDSPWKMRSIADPFDVEFEPRFDARRALVNLSPVYGNPVWLRGTSGSDPVAANLAQTFGYDICDLAPRRALNGIPSGVVPRRMRW
ncbi:hypothetical protein F8O07_06625 [Pseudoclavibacter sp. CFCC 13796]|uniref:hypothetical protein n=1 Tax=Pseudoclavibacter sp. CFCC 13796 TaxID=2615179 RepID=UPI0013017954|nr:hypothetical protein [Pseudoclavibacter sp. CFCC 13796]KAB1661573.1 hypothetical protein F8O07_06625 [Pseudoclavibacter sp. CFCC 13796]